jgi:hypothetical protein
MKQGPLQSGQDSSRLQTALDNLVSLVRQAAEQQTPRMPESGPARRPTGTSWAALQQLTKRLDPVLAQLGALKRSSSLCAHEGTPTGEGPEGAVGTFTEGQDTFFWE